MRYQQSLNLLCNSHIDDFLLRFPEDLSRDRDLGRRPARRRFPRRRRRDRGQPRRGRADLRLRRLRDRRPL